MAQLPWENNAIFIAEGTQKVFDDYLAGESPRVAVSFALSLLVNIIELTENKEEIVDDVIGTLEKYKNIDIGEITNKNSP